MNQGSVVCNFCTYKNLLCAKCVCSCFALLSWPAALPALSPNPHRCRGHEDVHTLTTDGLRKMKLYSDARVRYTLHKAVEIAWTCGASLKASDFGFIDQVLFTCTSVVMEDVWLAVGSGGWGSAYVCWWRTAGSRRTMA